MNIKILLDKNRIKKAEPIFKIIGLALVLAIITNLLFQGAQMLNNPIKTLGWVAVNFKKFSVSTVFIFFIYLFIIALIGNFYSGAIVSALILGAVAFANLNKMKILQEPLYPVDFYQVRYAKELFSMIGGHITPLTIILAATVTALIVFFIKRLPKLSLKLVPRLILALFSLYMIYSYVNYDETFVHKYFDKAGMGVVLWNQQENYANNGFVFGLLSNLQNEVMEKPEGYSKEAVKRIVEKYKSEAETINAKKKAKNDIKPNIIYYMNEAFWDPANLTKVKYSEDPMRNLREIMKKYSSGKLISPVFGGNTANTEFEALTGLSMYNVLPGAIPYQQSMDNKQQFPSLVSLLEEEGYDTLAMHPFKGMFYKRDRVYEALGIDKFIDETGMKYKESLTEGEGGYINDQSVVNQMMDALKEKDNPLFMHVVTMQNHFPFVPGKFGKESIKTEGLSQESSRELEAYAEAAKQSDLAFKNFVDFLDNYEEPTVVIFFGDHLPKLIDETFETGGIKVSDALENERKFSQTPLVIYSNFPLEKKDLKELSPAFLGPELFAILDKPITPYYAMLDKIKQQLPGLKKEILVDSKGQVRAELTKEEQELIKDYNMIQYDIMMGEQYCLPLMLKKQ